MNFAITPLGLVVDPATGASTEAAGMACADWIATLPRLACDATCAGVGSFRVSASGRVKDGEWEIEKCDDCGRFDDDLAAIEWLFTQGAPWVPRKEP